jgi:hypothetical protein
VGDESHRVRRPAEAAMPRDFSSATNCAALMPQPSVSIMTKLVLMIMTRRVVRAHD